MDNNRRGGLTNENEIFSNPDHIIINGNIYNYNVENAYGFLFNTYDKKCMYLPPKMNHQVFMLKYVRQNSPKTEIKDSITLAQEKLNEFNIQGRIWLNIDEYDGVISTWYDARNSDVFSKICKKFGLNEDNVVYVYGTYEPLTITDMIEDELPSPEDFEKGNEMRQIHTLSAKDKWDATSDFRTDKYNIIAQRNKEDGWGNATQAEINWWKNKGLDENVEDDEYMIGDEGDGNLGYFHVNENINLLNEDRENVAMKAAINYLIQQGQSKENAQKIFNALRNDIPSIKRPLYTNNHGREKGTYKFAIGVERMYLNGELSNGEDVMKFNKTLRLLANGHADKYDSNLNGMSAREINQRFEQESIIELQKDIENVNSEEYTPNGYTVAKIPDFKTTELQKGQIYYADGSWSWEYDSQKNPVGVIFADINRLKYVNDTEGHEAGNVYIRTFADKLKKAFYDWNCYRVSGDEFIVVYSGEDEEGFYQRKKEFEELIL